MTSAESSNTSSPSQPPKPVYHEATTGSLVKDVWLSITHIGQVPCARNALLSGIASGAGIGVIRGLSAGAFIAGNWAVATFAMVSIGSWHICQNQLARERQKIEKIVEQMPQRMVKQKQGEEPNL